MSKFINSDKFCIEDMPEQEALLVMDELSAMADSVDMYDRVHASDLYNGASRHTSLEVVSRTLDVSRWLLSHELFAGTHENMDIEEVDIDDPTATMRIEINGVAHALRFPTNEPNPVHPTIQKNVVRELAMIGARPEADVINMATDAVGMLGIVSMKSLTSPEARQAVGWVGRNTPHHEVSEMSLGILRGTVLHDASQIVLLDTDPLRASLIGMHAIAERVDGFLAIQTAEAIEETQNMFNGPDFDQVYASAARRQLGADSPFTEYPRN